MLRIFYFKLLLDAPLRMSVEFMLGDFGATRVTSLFRGTIVPSLNARKTDEIMNRVGNCYHIFNEGRNRFCWPGPV